MMATSIAAPGCPAGVNCPCAAHGRRRQPNARSLALAYLDAALSRCEQALDDAGANVERAAASLVIARIAVAVAQRVRLSPEVEAQP